jgi:hypothetical protein
MNMRSKKGDLSFIMKVLIAAIVVMIFVLLFYFILGGKLLPVFQHIISFLKNIFGV